ncbi:urea ABC transporter ATP-binding protein UrtD [Acidihalobacter ferrooxydans]|uniref:Urea ABC transporter ATP-binding protein UrtD n=1 Tax=Acidihalobacter ferrooxydans TaxID=1765967 RepID=A0A1P8UKH1_9GAMM|nr:urea ABC transporter ATP-binding protein UrtD [Acidihalobacter ferrooxydans]APZ44329.1 urea ABC transporter ATP-binding protein UrtD [Acidihalobacter ferrooxydans]
MSSQTQNILEVFDIVVEFDGFRAIDSLSLAVRERELTVAIGPNGAGKTTLVDVVTGRTRPSAGNVMFDGTDITRWQEHRIVRAGIARKFQAPSVFPDLTLEENLYLAARTSKTLRSALFGRRSGADVALVAGLLEQTGLTEQARRQAQELSHGQKQWLEIAMTLALQPRLLILDEPIAGMTQEEIEVTVRLLRELARERSVLVIEHDMAFVRSIAERVIVLHQGRLLAEGGFDHVSVNPQVRKVYLGEEEAA